MRAFSTMVIPVVWTAALLFCSMLCLTAFFLFALMASPRLHNALVNNNYPLK